MKNKAILFLLLLLPFIGLAKPNVVILFADDYGIGDIGVYNPIAETPNLDRLAKEGARFSNFYVHVKCAPSRAALLTGRHFLKTGVWGVHSGRDYLHPSEQTIADAFRANGYVTGMTGKWHSGTADGYYPWQRGFDEAHMARLYKYNPEMGAADCFNGETTLLTGWAQDYFAGKAVDFIAAHKNDPFFLYVPFMSTHSFWRTPESYYQKHRKKGHSEGLSMFLGMAEFMDVQIGRIFQALEKNGVADNTIVLFLSDNGPIGSGGPAPWNPKEQLRTSGQDWNKRNALKLSGGKGRVLENGIKSALFVRWPEHIPAERIDVPASIEDLFPTLLDLAGAERPAGGRPLDGTSLKPLLAGSEDGSGAKWMNRPLFFSDDSPLGSRDNWSPSKIQQYHLFDKEKDAGRFVLDNMYVAVRRGDWKLIHEKEGWQLFNVKTDPGEHRPQQNPEREKELYGLLGEWWADVLDVPYSFWKPTLQIGVEADDVPVSLPVMTAYRSDGDVKLTTDYAYNWKDPGDALRIRVNVKQAGSYRGWLAYTAKMQPDARFCVTLAGIAREAHINRPVEEISEHTIYDFEPEKAAELGEFDLPAGEMELIVELVDNPSGKPLKIDVEDVVLMKTGQ